MARKQFGISIEEDIWHELKAHCVRKKLKLVDKAGDIIEEWVEENCRPGTDPKIDT